jgi:hypothetical protein
MMFWRSMRSFPKRYCLLLAGSRRRALGPNYKNQASSMSPLVSIISVRSLVTHSRIYAEQFRSRVPSSSLRARNFTASRSTSSTFWRWMAAALASASIALRSVSRSCFVIRPLMPRTTIPSPPTTRSIRQLILRPRTKLLLFCSSAFLSAAMSKLLALRKPLKLWREH